MYKGWLCEFSRVVRYIGVKDILCDTIWEKFYWSWPNTLYSYLLLQCCSKKVEKPGFCATTRSNKVSCTKAQGTWKVGHKDTRLCLHIDIILLNYLVITIKVMDAMCCWVNSFALHRNIWLSSVWWYERKLISEMVLALCAFVCITCDCFLCPVSCNKKIRWFLQHFLYPKVVLIRAHPFYCEGYTQTANSVYPSP